MATTPTVSPGPAHGLRRSTPTAMMGSMHPPAPPAIEPFYRCARNQPIVLFRGRVDLAGPSEMERHRGGIVLDWLPSPTLTCWARGPASRLGEQSVMGSAKVDLIPRTPLQSVPRQSKTTRSGPRTAARSFETSSRLLDYECGDRSAALTHALLHVVNVPRLYGRPLTWPDGSTGPGRLWLEAAGWTITLDDVQGAAELQKNLENNRGFALTHTARAERTTGDTFTPAELKDLADAFTYFCWLCAEARCGPMLPVGFDDHNRAVWSRWNTTRAESFPADTIWLDRAHAEEAEALFPSFMARFGRSYWRHVLTHAIEYLTEAGRPQTVQRAIIMAHLLLEAVSYSWLVEKANLRTDDSFEKHTAAQNIRAMLTDMGIPAAIPDGLPALAATRTKKGHRVDGPGALALTRNDIIHRRRAAPTLDYAPLIEAWRLGAWYAELVVLRLCGFNGLYRNRLTGNPWPGAVEPVPWR